MNTLPPLPDLGTLTGAEKDELIEGLWRTLATIEAGAAVSAASDDDMPATVADLRTRIGRTAPSRRAAQVAGRRAGWRRLAEFRLLWITLAVVALGCGADFAIGWYQGHLIDNRRRAALELENAAFAGLYVELVRVSYEPDGKSYRISLDMHNLHGDAPLYIMLSPAHVFVQVGLNWQGVPTEAAPGTHWGVVKLEDAGEIQMVFQADVENFAQLMPGYMHLRIQSDMLISRSSEPRDDLVERPNRFNVYLKPQNANDAEIKRKLTFPGAPPIFIPMPPH